MFTINRIKLLNYFVSLVPLSYIIGNLAINLNIFLIFVTGFFIYRKKIFFISDKKIQYLIYCFFFYLIIITFLNNIFRIDLNKLYLENIVKSIFFLRFLLFFLVINKMVEKNDLNFRLLIISCAFFSLILSIDIIIQVIFGKNLFGYEIVLNRPSGFFGSENIAGGYLQKFLIFLIFFIPIYFKKKRQNLNILFSFLIFSIPIILTLNRMSLIIFFMSIILYLLIEKEFKKILILIFFSCSLLFLFLKNTPTENIYKVQINNYIFQSKEIVTKGYALFTKNYYSEDERVDASQFGYLIHFNSGIQIWKENKIFGHGLKSFRLKCKYDINQTCNTHPHNYFIELMMDVGVFGIILIYSVFFFGMKNFIKFYFSSNDYKKKYLNMPFFLITFFEFFPFRSTGSFFTTNNAIIIFMMLVIFINSYKIKPINL